MLIQWVTPHPTPLLDTAGQLAARMIMYLLPFYNKHKFSCWWRIRTYHPSFCFCNDPGVWAWVCVAVCESSLWTDSWKDCLTSCRSHTYHTQLSNWFPHQLHNPSSDPCISDLSQIITSSTVLRSKDDLLFIKSRQIVFFNDVLPRVIALSHFFLKLTMQYNET